MAADRLYTNQQVALQAAVQQATMGNGGRFTEQYVTDLADAWLAWLDKADLDRNMT